MAERLAEILAPVTVTVTVTDQAVPRHVVVCRADAPRRVRTS
ncbi:hypothetical protein [Streptomyces fractus]